MKNIIIFSESGSSNVESFLGKIDNDYIVQMKKPDEIKQLCNLNPDLVILENSNELTKDLLARNKISVPLLIVSNELLTNIPVRTEAYDYVFLPVNNEELKIRVSNLLRIKQLKDDVNVACTTDELTGLYNRTYLHERLEAELSRSKRYNISLSCLLLDIDFFKVVNDIYGYDWGDVLLKKITEVIRKYARKEDIPTRYGDEEFLIVLPSTDEDSAYIFAERLRKDIELMEFKPDGEEERHPITISGGISSYPFQVKVNETAQTLIRYAEHALYNAKKRGKNKIIQFSQINMEL